jgi:hypothetical protein
MLGQGSRGEDYSDWYLCIAFIPTNMMYNLYPDFFLSSTIMVSGRVIHIDPETRILFGQILLLRHHLPTSPRKLPNVIWDGGIFWYDIRV